MEQTCGNCRYEDLDSDVMPCMDCRHCLFTNKNDHWAPNVEDIKDPFEKLGALLEYQTYLLIDVRNTLHKLKENN